MHPSDEAILGTYHECFAPFYRAMSVRCNGDRELTEDIVQETWLRAVKAWRSDGIPDSPVAWLVTVASRVLLNLQRRAAPDPLGTVHDTIPVEEPREEEHEAVSSVVRRALNGLPRMQKALLHAFHFENRRVADIARLTGMSDRAVEGRLRRARLALRRKVELDPTSKEIIP